MPCLDWSLQDWDQRSRHICQHQPRVKTMPLAKDTVQHPAWECAILCKTKVKRITFRFKLLKLLFMIYLQIRSQPSATVLRPPGSQVAGPRGLLFLRTETGAYHAPQLRAMLSGSLCTETLEARPTQHERFVQCPSCEVSAPLRTSDTEILGCPNTSEKDHLLWSISMEERGWFLLQLLQYFPRHIKLFRKLEGLHVVWPPTSECPPSHLHECSDIALESQVSEGWEFWIV